MPKCEYDTCTTIATYGYKSKHIQFCAKHKIADMMKLQHNKLCEYNNCNLRPSFNIINNPPIVCAKHKSPNMINVVSKRCEYDGCNILNPVFDIEGGKGRFCVSHKEKNMIDVCHKLCEFDDCKTQASFDIKGGKGRFCSIHKEIGMIDIKNRYCEYNNCDIVNPIFNIKGYNFGRFCLAHKEENMIDVKHKSCEYKDCEVRPNYNIKGGRGRFCITHKEENMIDVTHRSCEYKDCNVRPNYDIKGGKGRFCITHKEEHMIDIANKCCIIDNCVIRARYGKPGHKITHCSTHKEKGMIYKSNAKCNKCKNIAIWGINLTPIHCELHKTENDCNLIENNCISCGLLYILDNDNKCENCSISSKKYIMKKQNDLMTYLDSRDLCGDKTDSIIDNGRCGKERPDRIYDFEDKIIILECDENQHSDRACLCEQIRMVNIGQSFGGIPVYFIRFNPDNYKLKYKGLSHETLAKRYDTCGNLIQDIKNQRIKLPVAMVSAIYLYYDNWESLHNEKWTIITPFE